MLLFSQDEKNLKIIIGARLKNEEVVCIKKINKAIFY
jgi:hypothetical protein